MTKAEMSVEALSRATKGDSLTNYPAIFSGFMEKGILESEIKPRENVFTFKAWLAMGRVVRKGEHGVKVVTFIETHHKDDSDKESKKRGGYRRPWATTVFHISQTDVLDK